MDSLENESESKIYNVAFNVYVRIVPYMRAALRSTTCNNEKYMETITKQVKVLRDEADGQ